MTDEQIARATARHFGLDPALIIAVMRAEGNILRAVQCSLPHVTTVDEAIEVLCRSAVHALSDFVKRGALSRGFVDFWAARWAPTNAANDPTHLNRNWATNVKALWLGSLPSKMDTGSDIPGGGAA